MPECLPSYWLKLERARRHIRDLAHETNAFLARNPYSAVIETDADRELRVWKLKVSEPIPPEWSAVIGDAIHNIRTALDHIMVAVVRHCDPSQASYKHVYFVIRETRKKFEEALPKSTKGVSPEVRSIVASLQPYRGGNDVLYWLHELDIIDKHNAIIPVGAAHDASGVTFHARRAATDEPVPKSLEQTTFYKMKDAQFPLKDGAELWVHPLGVNLPYQETIQFRFEVAFGEGQVVDGAPIIPTLSRMWNEVERILKFLEQKILNR